MSHISMTRVFFFFWREQTLFSRCDKESAEWGETTGVLGVEIDVLCHTYEWGTSPTEDRRLMSHIRMRHVPHLRSTTHVTHMNEACTTHDPCPTHVCLMSHIRMRHVPHTKNWCPTSTTHAPHMTTTAVVGVEIDSSWHTHAWGTSPN